VTEEQADAIIKSVTGLSADHPSRLEVAFELGDNLIKAVQVLAGDAAICNEPWCANPDHYVRRA
jgi:hypothetical protein